MGSTDQIGSKARKDAREQRTENRGIDRAEERMGGKKGYGRKKRDGEEYGGRGRTNALEKEQGESEGAKEM